MWNIKPTLLASRYHTASFLFQSFGYKQTKSQIILFLFWFPDWREKGDEGIRSSIWTEFFVCFFLWKDCNIFWIIKWIRLEYKMESIFQSYNSLSKPRQAYVGYWDLSLCNQKPLELNEIDLKRWECCYCLDLGLCFLLLPYNYP